jgi:sugar lactone lactonase YvrE
MRLKKAFLLSVLTLCVGVASARAQTVDVNRLLREGKILRASEVKRGMTGVGKSVFQGTKVESFRVVVMGTLEKVDSGGDIVLIKVLDGPVVERKSGVIQGMSGSPIYFNGKLLGAVAYSMGAFPREPICGVKPIIEMIETTNPKPRPQPKTNAPQPVSLPDPIRVGDREFRRVLIETPNPQDARRKTQDALILKPAQTMMMVSGMSERSLPLLRKVLGKYGITPVLGPGSSSVKANPTLEAGAAVAVQLASGDVDFTGVGTVTYREGNRVLAFGHPMFSLGHVAMPMATAYIHDIFPAQEISFKMGSALKAVGTVTNDGVHAIAGNVGGTPDMVPMQIKVSDQDSGWTKTFNVQVINDKIIMPQLALLVANEAIGSIFGSQAEATVHLNLAVDADGIKPIRRTNVRFAPGAAGEVALVDLADAISFVTDDDFGRPRIKKISLEASLEHTRRNARVKRIFANRAKVKPGDELEIGVVLEPYPFASGKTVTETFKFTVPKDSPGGLLRVGAGTGGVAELLLRSRLGVRMPQPNTLTELLEFYEGVHANNELVVSLALPRLGVTVANRPVPSLPSSALQLMFLSRSSDIQVFREDLLQAKRTDWYIIGMQFLSVQVDSPKKAISPPLPPTGTLPSAGGSPSSGGATPAATDDDADFEHLLLTPAKWDGFNLPRGRFVQFLKTFHQQRIGESANQRIGEEGLTPLQAGGIDGGSTRSPFAIPSSGERPSITLPQPGQGVGRPSRSWVQRTPADFLTGTFDGTCVTSKNDLRLGPKSKTYFAWQQPYFWSAAVDGRGNLYLGSGNDGKIFKVARDGQSHMVFDPKDVAIHALAFDSQGNLYAGGAPTGKVYKITPDGKAAVFADTQKPIVWSLTVDKNDNLFIGTGGGKGGVIYKVGNGLSAVPEMTTFAALPADRSLDHVRCLAVDDGGNVYAGTGDEGVLYRIAPDGADGKRPTMTALYHSPDGEILSLALDGKGGIYFGTSGKGTVYRWRRDEQRVEEIYASPQNAIYALVRDKDGSVYAGTGNTSPLSSALGGVVYKITPDKIACRILEPDQPQTLSLALGHDNKLFAATANNAVVYQIDLPYNPTGKYESAVFDAKVMTRWGMIRWDAEEPEGGRVWLEVRSGNTKEPDASWSDWVAYGDPNGSKIQNPASRFVQYRANFHSEAGKPTPILSRVELIYRTQNQLPTVKFEVFRSQYWRGRKQIEWQASDPDGDKLSYRLAVMGAKGTQELDREPTSEKSYSLDTARIRDGVYRLRLLASDELSNPESPLFVEDVSEQIVIDNTAPTAQIDVKRDEQNPLAVAFNVTTSDNLLPITSAEFRVDKDEWKALQATDGIFDSKNETLTFGIRFRDLKEHVIEIQVRDAAGNAGTVSYTFKPGGDNSETKSEEQPKGTEEKKDK